MRVPLNKQFIVYFELLHTHSEITVRVEQQSKENLNQNKFSFSLFNAITHKNNRNSLAAVVPVCVRVRSDNRERASKRERESKARACVFTVVGIILFFNSTF